MSPLELVEIIMKKWWEKIFFVGLFLLLILIYWQPILEHPLLSYDDQTVVVPMKTFSSLQAYVQLVKDNIIYDRQPVRDLFFWSQFQVEDFFGFLNFQLVNLIIWFLALIGTYKILRLEKISLGPSLAVLSLAALHPLVVNSVAWPTAQKHLLSAGFVIWATYFWLKALLKKEVLFAFLAMLFFILANLAQPINLGWIIWAALALWMQKNGSLKAQLKWPLVFGAMGLVAIAFVNDTYYSSESYAALSGSMTKFVNAQSNTIGTRLLIWGRDFFQILFPMRPSISSYDVSGPLGLIGIFLLAMALYLLYQLVKREVVLKWLPFIVAPILMMTLRLTHQPGSDTYLLVPLLGTAILVAHIIQEHFLFIKKHIFKLGLGLLVFLSFESWVSFNQASAWTSDHSLWQRAVELEPSFINRTEFARVLLNERNYREAWLMAQDLFKERPDDFEMGYIYGRSLFQSPDLSAQEKEHLFGEANHGDPWIDYFWSALDAQQGNFLRAQKRLRKGWEHGKDKYIASFQKKLTNFAAKWFLICQRAGLEDCDQVHTMIHEAAPPSSKWSENEWSSLVDSNH